MSIQKISSLQFIGQHANRQADLRKNGKIEESKIEKQNFKEIMKDAIISLGMTNGELSNLMNRRN